MNLEPKIAAESAESPGGLFSLALLSLLAGAAAGLVGAVFRLSLDQADHLRLAIQRETHGLDRVREGAVHRQRVNHARPGFFESP